VTTIWSTDLTAKLDCGKVESVTTLAVVLLKHVSKIYSFLGSRND